MDNSAIIIGALALGAYLAMNAMTKPGSKVPRKESEEVLKGNSSKDFKNLINRFITETSELLKEIVKMCVNKLTDSVEIIKNIILNSTAYEMLKSLIEEAISDTGLEALTLIILSLSGIVIDYKLIEIMLILLKKDIKGIKTNFMYSNASKELESLDLTKDIKSRVSSIAIAAIEIGEENNLLG